MLTVLVGTDLEKRGAHLEKILSRERAGGSEIVHYTDVNFKKDEIVFSANSANLFGVKNIFVITGVYDNTDLRGELETILATLSDSTEHFILCEKSILAPFMKKLTALKATVEKFESEKDFKKESFNVFALTDAYCDKKRSMAWAIYRAGISAGIDSHQLHGNMVWAIKNMIIAKKTKSANESGLNPFVYSKAKKFAEKFGLEELQQNLVALSQVFHESMFTGVNLETSLEVFILRSLE